MNLHQTDVCRLPKPTCLTALLRCHRLSISLSLWSCPTPFNQGVIFLKLKSDHMTLLWNGLLCCCLWIKSKLLGTEPNTMWGLVSGQSWSHCLETCAIYALVILPSLEIWKIPCYKFISLSKTINEIRLSPSISFNVVPSAHPNLKVQPRSLLNGLQVPTSDIVLDISLVFLTKHFKVNISKTKSMILFQNRSSREWDHIN